MAKIIATEAAVKAAAEALLADGEEPQIINVQERIGGGSYSTVKQYLELWRAERQVVPPVVVPNAVAAKGVEFTQALWAAAATLADEQTQHARDEAQQQVAQARIALAEAEAQVGRLEVENDAQGQELVTALRAIERLERDLIQTRGAQQVAEARAQELERQVRDTRAELEQARGVERQFARLEGETEALRRQTTEQQALIERLSAAKQS